MIDVREIITRFRTLWEEREKLLLLLTQGSSPSRPRLRKLTHELRRILLNSPEWLSWRTEPLADIRRRRERAERHDLKEQFHRTLHRWHTLGASVALWLIASVLLIGVSVAIGLVLSRQGVAVPVELAGTLVTLTEMVGGAAGILFAVIVFGIQFHGERLGQASYLARYFGRREGLIPIAAFSLAVVTANACIALLCSQGMPHSALPMAYLDYLCIPLVLFFLLFLLHRMVVSVSADIFDRSLVPGMCWEYERAIDEELRHAALMEEYEKVLDAARLRYSCGAGLLDVDPVAPIKFKFPGKWLVVDVNLTALTDLGAYIRTYCPGYEGTMSVGPQDVVEDAVVFVLSAVCDDQGRQRRDVQSLSDECRREVQRRLCCVFQQGRVRERDVVEVLAQFEKTIVSQARHDRADPFERGLGVLERLVELRLRRGESWKTHHSFRRERLADMLEGFEYFHMAANAVGSGDQEKVSALLVFACHMMIAAIEHKHPGLCYRAGQIVEAVYFRAIQGTTLTDYVGETVDAALSTLGAQFAYAHSSWRCDPPRIAAQMPVLIVDLGWRLRLIRAAIEAGRTTDATNFEDRMFRWDEHSRKRYADPQEEEGVSPELREACDLISCAALIVAAWCVYLLVEQTEQNHKHADTAKAVFQKCASDLGSREHLLRLWEALRSKSFTGRPLDDPFGVTEWTSPSLGRVGVSVPYQVSDSWIERGFMALMLARPSARKYEVPDAMRSCPPFRPKSPEEVRTLANDILGNEAVRTGLLNIADDKRESTVDAVVSLFADRLRLFKLDRLTAVVSSPLRDEHRTRLHAQIAKALGTRHGMIEMLEKLGGLQSNAHSWFLPRINYGVWLQKDSVVDCCEHPMDFAPLIARSLQERENTWITRAAERIAESTRTVSRLAELADAVRDAVSRLRQTTRHPILVLVSQERRIVEALGGQQAWHLPNCRVLGVDHLGEWEGCQLIEFPYHNCSSVVIVDALGFYGRVEDGAGARLDLDITNPEEAKHEEALRQAESESDPTKIPETDTIRVLALARLSASVGLCNPDAALRVDLDLSQIGFAMVKGDGLYHRPDCSLLAEEQREIAHTLAYQMTGDEGPRTPCERCCPDDWADTPAHEKSSATAAE